MSNWVEAQIQYWNTLSSKYDTLYKNQWSKLENTHLLQKLRSFTSFTTSSSILDIGCGTGLGYELCRSAINVSYQYTGIDISPEMINLCRDKWPEVSFFVADMKDLSQLQDDQFDFVLCLFTAFSFTDQPQTTLNELFRVVRNDGEIVLSVLSKHSTRRLIRNIRGNVEEYSTRYTGTEESVPAYVYSKTGIVEVVSKAGFVPNKIFGQGFFSGIWEMPPLWQLDKALSKFLVNFSHIINCSEPKKLDTKIH